MPSNKGAVTALTKTGNNRHRMAPILQCVIYQVSFAFPLIYPEKLLEASYIQMRYVI